MSLAVVVIASAKVAVGVDSHGAIDLLVSNDKTMTDTNDMELQDDGTLPVVSDTSDMDMMDTNADMGDVQFAGAESLEEAASSLGCPKEEKQKAHKDFSAAQKKHKPIVDAAKKAEDAAKAAEQKAMAAIKAAQEAQKKAAAAVQAAQAEEKKAAAAVAAAQKDLTAKVNEKTKAQVKHTEAKSNAAKAVKPFDDIIKKCNDARTDLEKKFEAGSLFD